jgi:hypothetical protein
MSRKLNMNKIAKGLGAERRGKVSSKSGYFGALQLVADIKARFHTPSGGGRATDPNWTERRLVPFASETLVRLEELAAKIREDSHVSIEPMQLAGILLERSAEQFSTKEVAKLIEPIISRQ